ncbi:glycosyltransferase [Paenibacillus sp. FSL K6-1096]|uniref:glycosyltransferase n=1 Tax=Paenibacillus sp. FSL K6-1096 TaxID=2921460 RepID=UPI0030ECC561
MNLKIPLEFAARFAQLGSNTYIGQGGLIEFPELISIGNNVSVEAPHSIKTAIGDPQIPHTGPAIFVGDGCQISRGAQITAHPKVILERSVLIGPNVQMEGDISIGEGSWIGANCRLSGNIRIGAGSVVKANSIVLDNVPDYCMVSGNPASIIQIYETSSMNWVDVSDHDHAQAILTARSQLPLLSICIPTYNRAPYLDICLHSIFSQIGNNELIEVVVSDNASTDATPAVIDKYMAQYSNMKSVRNDTNIGGDANILYVLQLGRGKFVKMQGDDDYFLDGKIMPLLHELHSHPECGVFHISVINGNRPTLLDSGMSNFLAATTLYAAFISSVVLRREDLENIENPALFIPSKFNQLYLQYSILKDNPNFCIMYGNIFSYGGAYNPKYSFAEVFFNGYPSILSHFVGAGLSAEDIARVKRETLYHYTIPWLRDNKATVTNEEFEEIYKKYYQDEPYYEDGLAIMEAIRQS